MFDSVQHLMSFWYIFLEIYLDDIIWWDLFLISYFEAEEVLGSKHMILLTSLFILHRAVEEQLLFEVIYLSTP